MISQFLPLSLSEKERLDSGFEGCFGYAPTRYFSAPGRTELSGNHTDHQRGKVLAAAVDLQVFAAVAVTDSRTVRVCSKGFPVCEVELDELEPKKDEVNTSPALIRGIAARFAQKGCTLSGVDIYTESTVLPGSGLSSSAAFEVLIGTVFNLLFFDGKCTAPEIAMIGQYAENVYFGKPCGLMDQMASAVGGMVAIDFARQDAPQITPIAFDFAACGYSLCIIDSRASHAELTDEYAAIPAEMKQVAAFFGKEVLGQVDEDAFYAQLADLRKVCPDRAVLRAMHFFAENRRVTAQTAALEAGDFEEFLRLVRDSGASSFQYLQNVIPTGQTENQAVALTLGLCRKLLGSRGAYRVHGGGFAGTVQAFVPRELLESFRTGIDGVLGENACHVLSIRPQGGVEAKTV